jgi:hypothetical protein
MKMFNQIHVTAILFLLEIHRFPLDRDQDWFWREEDKNYYICRELILSRPALNELWRY